MAADKTSGWNEKLEIPGHVRFMEGVGDLPMLSVTTEWSTAEVYLQGAHVTHFQKRGEMPLLFLSQVSRYEAEQAIRGGVPVIFPWFGPREGQPAHGFARLRAWDLKTIVPQKDGSINLRFRLPENGDNAGFSEFTADYVVTVGSTLTMQLIVTNRSTTQELIFEDCLHTYFAVGDINAVSIRGLQGTTYVDKVEHSAIKTESSDAIAISSEVDRVYEDTTGPVEIIDAALKRKIHVGKENSFSTVVWNPWIAKSQALPDFGTEDYLKMVCVESGNVGKNRTTLRPGGMSALKIRLSTEPL